MSAEETSSLIHSPVTRLPPDILWLVFKQNTFVDSSRMSSSPLSTCVRTSQVCHGWRVMMLDTPSFWGRLIDFNHPFLVKKAWRIEILNRSGDAPLWIRGTVKTRPISDYLFSIINNHWERIQVFNIFASKVVLRTAALPDDQLWAGLLRPAPLLEEFKLSHGFHPFLFSNSPVPLFADDAPRLKAFSVSCVDFRLDAPWIASVQEIHITTHFTLTDVLRRLANMKAMRLLMLGGLLYSDGDVIEKPIPVTFEHLEALQIRYSPLEVWLPLLKSIESSTSCALQLVSVRPSQQVEPPEAVLHTASDQILKFMHSGLPSYGASRIILKSGHFDGAPFEFQISFLDNCDKNPIFLHLLDYPALSRHLMKQLSSSSLFSEIAVLDFQIMGDGFSELLAGMDSLVLSFTSVTTLKASPPALDFILRLCDHHVLPTLSTVIFYQAEQPQKRFGPKVEKKNRPCETLMAFLKYRRVIGLPISVVDISSLDPELLEDVDFLTDFQGLTIRRK